MTIVQAELEAMIGRAEKMCERYRAAADVRPLSSRSIAARRPDLRTTESRLMWLRARRATR